MVINMVINRRYNYYQGHVHILRSLCISLRPWEARYVSCCDKVLHDADLEQRMDTDTLLAERS